MKLTQEEKRIKIAEVCGWTNIVYRGILRPVEKDYIGRHESCVPLGASGDWSGVTPDYFNDLNACHEMEKILFKEQDQKGYPRYFHAYSAHLHLHGVSRGMNPCYMATHATATQRAEAFGLTLNLWSAED